MKILTLDLQGVFLFSYSRFLASIKKLTILGKLAVLEQCAQKVEYRCVRHTINTLVSLFGSDVIVSLDDERVPDKHTINTIPNLSGEIISYIRSDSLQRFLDQGAQIIIKHVEQKDFFVRQLVNTVENKLSKIVDANIIACKTAGQKFSTHYDDHDVIVIQLLGEKHWHWFEYNDAAVVEHSRLPYRMDEKKMKLLKSTTLQAGDTVFMPSKIPHQVISLGSSAHLTLGIHNSKDQNLSGYKDTVYINW